MPTIYDKHFASSVESPAVLLVTLWVCKMH